MRDRRGEPRRGEIRIEVDGQNKPWELDNDLVSHFTASVADQVTAGRRLGAIRTGLVSWKLNPRALYYAKPFVYALLPRAVMRIYRAAKQGRAKKRVARAASRQTHKSIAVGHTRAK